jgi:amylovoran biosynthesis glycosyltransferase AmsD
MFDTLHEIPSLNIRPGDHLAPTKSRRIAVLINDMNSAGGIQRMAANLARDLQGRYDVMLLTVEPLDAPTLYEPSSVFRSLDYRRNVRSRVSLLSDLFAVGLRLRQFVRKEKIDTVLAVWYDWASVAAFALPRSVKTVGWEHISYGEATRTWGWIRARAYPRLDAVVSVSAEDCQPLGRLNRNVRQIPNYVLDVDRTPNPGREKILLTVGHLVPRKGVDRLLWALKQPLMDNPDWKLVVVGGGEKGHVDSGYLDLISTLVQLLQLQGRVEFHPARSDIDEWYRRASIYVMGSRREGLPMVLIEAKAHGLPIVSFDCPTGPKEIIRNGVDGALVADDSIEFGKAAGALMQDAELRRRMGAAAIEDVKERFLIGSVTPQWIDLIESLHRDDGK